jgi:iron(III) transport system substrate-binding protein
MSFKTKNFLQNCIIPCLITAGTLLSSQVANAEGTVNIYSYRQADLIKPLLDKFTEKTGIKTQVLFVKKGMAERVKAEGANSPADVLLTVDIGRLTALKSAGVTQSLKSDVLDANIPAQYHDKDGNWFGITTRGRVIYASKERVSQNEITYEELADPKWKGKICVRSAQHAYNIALIASMIAHHGEAKAEEWLKGVKANLARKPNGNDRAQAKGIYSGECDLGIGNTYYVGLMVTNEKQPEQKEWAKAIKVLFPNSGEGKRGTHVNLSGMALAKHAPNKDNGIKLMEFLASDEGQQIYGEKVFEYPVKTAIEPSQIVKDFGAINPDKLALNEIAKYRKLASQLVDKVGFDQGPAN